jgi:uncharacterized protein (TIGR03118 family)
MATASAVVMTSLGLGVSTAGRAGASPAAQNEFRQTNLISNRTDQGAQIVDANLRNPWGLALGPTSPLWVANNNGNDATVYSINVGGTKASGPLLTVPLPGGRASTGDGASPTGQVFNPSNEFVIGSGPTSGPALFLFSSESGQITGWNRKAGAEVKFSSPTAVYKGLAIATDDEETLVYAANFHDRRVDVFNGDFKKVELDGEFQDRNIPSDYAPFGIQELGGRIYVSYAQQKQPDKHDDLAGPGHGFIDVFTTEGFLVKRLASRGVLNSPWGLALAPDGFGAFSDKLLVGNFGDGTINAFDPNSGKSLGALLDEKNQPVQIDDLWGLHFGTKATGGTSTLLFSAGIFDEKDGLVGSINAVP